MSSDDEVGFSQPFRVKSTKDVRCKECSGTVSMNDEGRMVCDYCGVVANFVQAKPPSQPLFPKFLWIDPFFWPSQELEESYVVCTSLSVVICCLQKIFCC
jgi:hypothetical protein